MVEPTYEQWQQAAHPVSDCREAEGVDAESIEKDAWDTATI